MHQIKVINGNKEALSDRYDGLLYHFVSGDKGTNVPLDAAEHIFGVEFPVDAKVCASDDFRERIWAHLQRRWGFNSVPTRKEMEKGGDGKLSVGKKIFSKLIFVPVEMKMMEVVAQNDDLPLPRGAEEDIEIQDEEAV